LLFLHSRIAIAAGEKDDDPRDDDKDIRVLGNNGADGDWFANLLEATPWKDQCMEFDRYGEWAVIDSFTQPPMACVWSFWMSRHRILRDVGGY
jgi:hypothetical protein